MATAQAALTPVANTAPAVVSIPAKELSGAAWVDRFPGKKDIDSCEGEFKSNITAFKAALDEAKADVKINATYRPPERAYMMHWSWEIVNNAADPKSIPSMEGVNINWDHSDNQKSIKAAKEMVNGFEIGTLKTAPALDSRHTHREAIDMIISWTGDLVIKNKDGTAVTIKSDPKTGMNTDLKAVGETYSVKKFVGGDKDIPHWSSTGH